jgi:Stress responsive A/B Barrel Domain
LLRHTVLFLWRDTTTDEQKLTAKKGLAHLSYACRSARFVDYGYDLLGGSRALLEVKPWKRTPLWRARRSGPVINFDMALHLDFDDEQGLRDYSTCPAHDEVSVYNHSVCRDERTARIDWWYEGPPRYERGMVRHTALYLWNDDAPQSRRGEVRAAWAGLASDIPPLRSVVVGDGVGSLTTDYDFVVDLHCADIGDMHACTDHPAYKEALELTAGATLFEWTARITHTMASG